LQTDTLDGKGQRSPLELKSLYADQVGERDLSRTLASKHGVAVHDSVARALALGGDKLAVDGVLLVAEHGNYSESDTGQIVYPKRRMFAEIADVIERSGRPVPVFSDKHLADNWQDAKWIYDTAQRLKVPLMAGSSLPTLWRYPPVDVRRGAQIKEIVAVSYHRLDTYGFHALEMVQCLAERRAGGETGVKSVQCLVGDAVWRAEQAGAYDAALLDAALSRLKWRPIADRKQLVDLVPEPVLFVIDYHDGLRTNVFTLNGAVGEWASAWKYADESKESALFWTQEARPFMHFTYLLLGIEKMMLTGRPAWPVERTLLTSGTLDALLRSKRDGSIRIDTPELAIKYTSDWNWQQPPEPPADRPIEAQ
jgi:hypothetical protein